MALTEFLRTINAFRSLDDAGIGLLASRCEPVDFSAGEMVIRRGEPGDAMYIIEQGAASAMIERSGRNRYVARLGVGDVFGEMALLTGDPRLNDVVADTELHCQRIKRVPILALLKKQPKVAIFLTEILGQRLLESGSLNQVGKYQVRGVIGEGGMARVFEGRHRNLGTTVAIKMLSHQHVLDEVWNKRFRRESRILASLRHENIVKVIDFEEAYATLFIITELIEGMSLYQALGTRGRFPHDEARTVLGQLALALDYAHTRGVIHRDVKPGNVLVEPSGRVKLMDFGIAKPLAEAGRESDDLLGTPEYMSPEQGNGDPLDGRADLYSLGILAFEILTGRPPFQAERAIDILDMHDQKEVPSLQDIDPKMPKDLVEFVRRATRKDPEERFQHGQEMAALLEGARPATLRLGRTRSRALTLLYEASAEERVEQLLNQMRAEVARVPGVHLSVSDSARVE